jgi:hypothetical protein
MLSCTANYVNYFETGKYMKKNQFRAMDGARVYYTVPGPRKRVGRTLF